MTQLKVKCKVIECKNGMYGLLIETDEIRSKTFNYLTCDKEGLCALADKINRLDVSFTHIEDIIDDFLE